MARTGRPSKYTRQLAARICEAVATTEHGLATILKAKGMPHYATVMRWLNEHADFRDMYARAKEEQADLMADRIVEIADGASPEDVQVARLRVDARKWAAAKLKPRKYGDRVTQEVSGVGGAPIEATVNLRGELDQLTDEELEARFRAKLAQRGRRAP